MVIGQERHVDVAVAQVLRGKDGPDVMGHVELGELHRLGQAGGAGRKQDDRESFAIHGQAAVFRLRHAVRCTLRQQLLRAVEPRHIVHAEILQVRKFRFLL